MDWLSVLQQIFEVCIIPLLGVGVGFLINLIQEKKKEISALTENETTKKYVDMLADTITKCVVATNQTYVDALKGKNAFTKEAQEEAFTMTYEAVLSILSSEARVYLANFYGDLDKYIAEQIEANVKLVKQGV